MSNYGNAAIKAVKICQTSERPDPAAAWRSAVLDCLKTLEGQQKGCPKSAFLGLCEEGVVSGIPRGKYTRGVLNKGYAMQALKLIQKDSSLVGDPHGLWLRVMNGKVKSPNHQMEVVIALWRNGLLAKA